MINNFLNNNVTSLPKVVAISTFLTDVLTLYYINNYWLQIKLESLVRLSFSLQGHTNVSQGTINQAQAVLGNSLGTMLFFFLLWHTVIYGIMFFSKKWAINYVYRYAFFTVLLTTIELFYLIKDVTLWFILLLILTTSYAFTFLGLRAFKKNLEQ